MIFWKCIYIFSRQGKKWLEIFFAEYVAAKIWCLCAIFCIYNRYINISGKFDVSFVFIILYGVREIGFALRSTWMYDFCWMISFNIYHFYWESHRMSAAYAVAHWFFFSSFFCMKIHEGCASQGCNNARLPCIFATVEMHCTPHYFPDRCTKGWFTLLVNTQLVLFYTGTVLGRAYFLHFLL